MLAVDDSIVDCWLLIVNFTGGISNRILLSRGFIISLLSFHPQWFTVELLLLILWHLLVHAIVSPIVSCPACRWCIDDIVSLPSKRTTFDCCIAVITIVSISYSTTPCSFWRARIVRSFRWRYGYGRWRWLVCGYDPMSKFNEHVSFNYHNINSKSPNSQIRRFVSWLLRVGEVWGAWRVLLEAAPFINIILCNISFLRYLLYLSFNRGTPSGGWQRLEERQYSYQYQSSSDYHNILGDWGMCWLIIAFKGRGSRRRGWQMADGRRTIQYYSWYVPDTRTPTRYRAGLPLHAP